MDSFMKKFSQQPEGSNIPRAIPVKKKGTGVLKGFTKSNAPSPVSDVRDVLKKGTSRMRTIQHYLCDYCDMPIMCPDDGFVIHGNIYVADPSCRGGLVGNNFPDVKPGEKIEVTDVKENVFCRTCLKQILELKNKIPRKV